MARGRLELLFFIVLKRARRVVRQRKKRGLGGLLSLRFFNGDSVSDVKGSLKFSALHSSHLSHSLLLSTSPKREGITGIQKWHLLKIKRLSQAANLMRV